MKKIVMTGEKWRKMKGKDKKSDVMREDTAVKEIIREREKEGRK